jgi:hypothetical protein
VPRPCREQEARIARFVAVARPRRRFRLFGGLHQASCAVASGRRRRRPGVASWFIRRPIDAKSSPPTIGEIHRGRATHFLVRDLLSRGRRRFRGDSLRSLHNLADIPWKGTLADHTLRLLDDTPGLERLDIAYVNQVAWTTT